MTWKTREDIAAGAYQQMKGTGPSSFLALNAESRTVLQAVEVAATSSLNLLRVSSQFIGHAAIRGIATISSGTTVVSVAATGIVSGDIILTGIIQYTSDQTLPGTIGQIPVTCARSVRTGAFEIVTIASYAPLAAMPVAWFKIA